MLDKFNQKVYSTAHRAKVNSEVSKSEGAFPGEYVFMKAKASLMYGLRYAQAVR